MKKIRIVLTGGGSGGHIYPLISIWEELIAQSKQANLDIEFIYMGPEDKWSNMIKEKGVSVSYILGGKMRRYFSFLNSEIPF